MCDSRPDRGNRTKEIVCLISPNFVYSTEPGDEARFMKTPLLVAISLQVDPMIRQTLNE
jgi:hypothetical protein